MEGQIFSKENRSIIESNTDVLDLIFKENKKYSYLIASALSSSLNTPAVIIKGLVESCIKDPNGDLTDRLQRILKATEEILNQLSNKPIFINSYDQGQSSYSLRDLINQICILFEKQCLQKGISLKNEVMNDLRVTADRNRMKSILISLVQNSVDSFDQNLNFNSKIIFLHAQLIKNSIELIVSDTGVGMSTDFQKQVLEKIFFSENEKFNTKKHLGLLLVKRMSDQIGAQVSFVSAELKGTTFTISLPTEE